MAWNRYKSPVKAIIVLAILGLSLWACLPIQKKIHLGLDLEGGVHLLLQLLPTGDVKTITSQIQSEEIQVIDRRINGLGVTEPQISKQGVDRIAVDLPQIKNAEQAEAALKQVAVLEYKIVPPAVAQRAEAAAATGSAGGAPPTVAPAGVSGTLEDVVSRAMPAVVRVETATGFGSGFFIAADTMLTNVHVVGTNTSVTIRRPDGKTVTARVDSAAPELDIAVIKISGGDQGQATLTMATNAPRAGQEVIALGTPLGLSNTVTRGIVSAVRVVGSLTLVQTDAAINPGNSGGPLLDRSGEVIGITTMAIKASEGQGLGFAVGIEHARALLSGKRTVDQRGTPISTLNEAMSGRPGASDAAGARDRATKTFEQAVLGLSRRADALDQQWTAFKRICYKGPVLAPSGGHEWFAIWDPKAMQGTVPQGCTSAFNDLQRVANAVRDEVIAAAEAARQADVYPGTRRDLLKRFRLDYPGWDR